MVSNRTSGAVLLLALALLASCRSNGRWRQSDYRLSYGVPLENPYVEPLTQNLLLVSDNQRHDLLGGEVDIFRTEGADRATRVAIRPPALDHYGTDFLRFAVAEADDRFIVHLGDACNMSTTTEFARFAWDMRRAPSGWVMAPGNHDGYFFGMSSRTRESLIAEWNDAAERWTSDGREIDGQALQKDRFVSFYVAALVLQRRVWSAGLARSLGPEGQSLHAEWEATCEDPGKTVGFATYWDFLNRLERVVYGLAETRHQGDDHDCEGCREFILAEPVAETKPHLRRMVWHIDRESPWGSYLTQEVEIGPPDRMGAHRDGTSMLILDTSQYGYQPCLDYALVSTILTLGRTVQVAGTHGNLLETQLCCALQPMIARMESEGRRWVIAGHHPYGELSSYSRARLDRLRDPCGLPFYISAHSHFGEYRWHEDQRRDGAWLELNVGSILDWPMEYRDFQLLATRGDGPSRIALHSRRFVLADVLRERGLLASDEPGYRASQGDADFYTAYHDDMSMDATRADFVVRRTLLATYVRMLALFAPDTTHPEGLHWPRDVRGEVLTDPDAVLAASRSLLDRVNEIGGDDEKEAALLPEMTEFLYELREYDESWTLPPAEAKRLTRFRMSQALWASLEEVRTESGRIPEVDPDHSFVIFPDESQDDSPTP